MEHRPDPVFLDVEMPDMTGLEMLSKLKEINFQTIFITAHIQYAISAIRFSALDYLLKPIDFTDLRKALKRYESRTSPQRNVENVQQAIQNMETPLLEDQKFVLPLRQGQIKPPLKEIISIKADKNYSVIQLFQDKQVLVTKTLLEFEQILKSRGFFRCHKSYLVNRSHIVSISNSNSIVLSNGHELPVSRRKKQALQDWYRSFALTNL